MKDIRLYGDFVNNGSAGSVTHGWRIVLGQRGRLAGTFCSKTSDPNLSLSDLHPSYEPSGADSKIALVADARELGIALAYDHPDIRAILAIHTGWIPHNLLHMILDGEVLVLCPSRWSLGKLKKVSPDVQCELVLHGVAPEFSPVTADGWRAIASSSLYKTVRGPGWNLAHFAESAIARKATLELIDAVGECAKSGMDVSLTVVASHGEQPKISFFVSEDPVLRTRVRVLPRLNAPPSKMRYFMACFDAIIQPSRIEGFGLTALEGLCLGIPAIITVGTGHLEWCLIDRKTLAPGIVPVSLGDETEARFEPGLAPTVSSEDIQRSLLDAYDRREQLKKEACACAGAYYDSWNWPRVLKSYVDSISERPRNLEKGEAKI